jgi:type I restriction enzyme, S subunit
MSREGWGKYRLQDLCSYIADGKHGDCRGQDDSGFYFLSAKDVSEGRLFYKDARQITKADFEDTHKRTRLEAFDILLTNSGTIGRMAIAEDSELTSRTTFQKSVAILKPIKQKVFPRFLYYCLVSRKADLVNTASGTTQQNLLLGDLRAFEVEIPDDIETQRCIADILSALDEKIELNRRTNATLEAIAQAIFKEWFVDFNFPGTTGEMEESALGMIPRGWRMGRLRDVCNVTMGQLPPGESYNETGEGIPFHQGRTDFGFRFPTQRVFTSDPKRFAKQFDTLVSVRAPVGDMNIATENCCIGRGLAAVIEKNGKHTFTYYFLRELTGKFKNFEDNGTVFGSINKKDFENMPCIVPNDGAIDAFEDKCCSIDESIFNNEQESSTLAALRDALLPKLMRGENEV